MKKLLIFSIFASFLFASDITATFVGKTDKLNLELLGININCNFLGDPAILGSKSDGVLSRYAKSISFSIDEQENNSKKLLKFISKNDKMDLIIKTNSGGTLSTYTLKGVKAYDFSASYSSYNSENNTTSPLSLSMYFSFFYDNLELDGIKLTK